MTEIGERVRRVRERMAEAALQAGRDPAALRLVAASKTMGAEAVRQAIAAGVDACGENRVQELVEKHGQGAYEGAPLHFIGHLQQNKVNQVVGRAALIQSVSSQALLQRIEARAAALGLCQSILLEVNIGREGSKSGFLPEAVEEAAALADTLPHIRLEGLMTIPPDQTRWYAQRTDGKIYPYFEEMYQLYIDIAAKKYDNAHIWCLSMGMSGDYAQAIRAGANMVRVGSAIFGPRQYGKPDVPARGSPQHEEMECYEHELFREIEERDPG